ncbi:peptidyl-prolyl cis-trans isomerase [Mesohalobacter halotolerans]|uniref:Peptidyl-prolyl cis-trans isomerase n=1 Tax=Mesohalobacter halotolerans TaxID=1883405 RepID=A0A4U5TQ15_9FLAO|nr:peptidyl-prolyl cis-trans isomerase [Mesohalobacter halotolerans]MBS3738072.1 peptidyl-prolyl cis-trans isomerase [Psychroflexus sp.]TKS56103.1 peptidyl-prolyl cis-trans isomerase [Mesohalobacter halotolerans]
MKAKLIFILCCLVFLPGCDLFQKQKPEDAIAKVNAHILYKKDLANVIPKNLSEEDSLIFTRSFINEWAMDKIILDKAKFNLPIKKQERYQDMVEKYKSELFKKAYMDAMIQKQIDSLVDSTAIKNYYETNKDMFKINEYLLKIRYLYIKNDLKNFSKIKESFNRFNLNDQDFLISEQLKFDKVKLNDSVWVKSLNVFKDLSNLDSEQHQKILSPNRYLEFKDSIGSYFIYVKDVLKPNSMAPESYIKPTIEQILISKKKQSLKKSLEKQILQDAIKNNTYEIFE